MNVLKTEQQKKKKNKKKSAYEMTSQFKDNDISCCSQKNGIIALKRSKQADRHGDEIKAIKQLIIVRKNIFKKWYPTEDS